MNIPYVDKYSSKCMLGLLSKDIIETDGVLSWTSRGKNHVLIIDEKINTSVIKRLKDLQAANFHYLSQESVGTLSSDFSIKKNRGYSVIIDVNNIDFSGKKNRRFRNYLNRHSNLLISDSLKNIDDLQIMLKKWSVGMGEKYFRNMSGKNMYFVKNGYNEGCENIFIYDGDDLVAFGIVSPVVDGKSVYIIGKALSHLYPGLAEYTDIIVYNKLYEKYGPFSINLGQGSGSLLSYKMKFPGARKQIHYHGSYIL